MGKTPTPLNAVKWLACANKGYYSKINSMNTINTGVQVSYSYPSVDKLIHYTFYSKNLLEITYKYISRNVLKFVIISPPQIKEAIFI